MGESQGEMAALAVVFMVLPILAVGLRFLAKSRTKPDLGADDWTILVALLFAVGMALCQLIGSTAGNLGTHEQFEDGFPISTQASVIDKKTDYTEIVLQNIANGLTKISLILFYRRLFSGKWFNVISLVFGAVIVVWIIGFTIPSILVCLPIAAFWDPVVRAQGAVCQTGPFFLGFAISDLLTDIGVLCLPIPLTLRLDFSLKRRLAVLGIFLLGAFVVVAGAIRLAIFVQQAHDGLAHIDFSYYSAPLEYWSLIESSIGIVCACLPTLRPLFIRLPHSRAETSPQQDPSSDETKSSRTSRLSFFKNLSVPNMRRASGSKSGMLLPTTTGKSQNRQPTPEPPSHQVFASRRPRTVVGNAGETGHDRPAPAQYRVEKPREELEAESRVRHLMTTPPPLLSPPPAPFTFYAGSYTSRGSSAA